MCHVGDAPGEIGAPLDLLRPGDIRADGGACDDTVRNGRVVSRAPRAEAPTRAVIAPRRYRRR